jgi:hypothetical protein
MNRHGRIPGGNMKMRKIENGEVLKMGDVMKLKSNQKAVPICLLVGQKVRDVLGYCGSDLEGFFRPVIEVVAGNITEEMKVTNPDALDAQRYSMGMGEEGKCAQ